MGYSPGVVVAASDLVLPIHKGTRHGSAFQFCRAVLSVGALLIAGTTSAHAGTFTAFGPQDYTRGTGAPVTVTKTFSVLNPNTQYTLKAFNGSLQDNLTELVSSGFVTVNGVQVVGPNNFNQNVTEVDVPVTLQGSNTIDVQVRGKPGGVLTIQIIGVDNDPPTITATASPAPNAAGWNNSNVTVTFTCSDATSPVVSCPAPQTLTTEGAQQVISGTATDAAGNSATTSVTLNIDKTHRRSVLPSRPFLMLLVGTIGIRETGFRNIAQIGGGQGAGIFQIDLGQNPQVTSAQAYDPTFAANFAANMLATNMATLEAQHPNLTDTQLLQATAASYNFGTRNISGNPNTIDVGTTGNNYGSNVLNLADCFQ